MEKVGFLGDWKREKVGRRVEEGLPHTTTTQHLLEEGLDELLHQHLHELITTPIGLGLLGQSTFLCGGTGCVGDLGAGSSAGFDDFSFVGRADDFAFAVQEPIISITPQESDVAVFDLGVDFVAVVFDATARGFVFVDPVDGGHLATIHNVDAFAYGVAISGGFCCAAGDLRAVGKCEAHLSVEIPFAAVSFFDMRIAPNAGGLAFGGRDFPSGLFAFGFDGVSTGSFEGGGIVFDLLNAFGFGGGSLLDATGEAAEEESTKLELALLQGVLVALATGEGCGGDVVAHGTDLALAFAKVGSLGKHLVLAGSGHKAGG